ncbi:MAG: glucokinase [Fusobacteriales bacterium]|nr:MAG: glucokinase [Fusobacteriales bacterium]
MSYYIGIDLGGTNTKIGIVNKEGNILKSQIIKTFSEAGVEETIKRIWESVKKIAQEVEIEISEIKGIGVGIPGPVVNQSIVTFFANFNWERNINLKEKFETLTGIKTRIENDANIIAQGEAIFGIAKGYSSSITVAVGTGIGGGIFIDGKLISGMSGVGGEVGHIKLVKDGKLCGCGQKGCFEAYASSKSLEEEALLRIKTNKNNLLYEKRKENLELLETKDIFECANKGDKFSQDLIEYESDYLAMGIGNLLNILNPEIIVLSGGISLAKDNILIPLKEKLKAYAIPPALEKLKIETGSLGNEAAIKGAVALFF